MKTKHTGIPCVRRLGRGRCRTMAHQQVCLTCLNMTHLTSETTLLMRFRAQCELIRCARGLLVCCRAYLITSITQHRACHTCLNPPNNREIAHETPRTPLLLDFSGLVQQKQGKQGKLKWLYVKRGVRGVANTICAFGRCGAFDVWEDDVDEI